jgi:GTPase SAR1 family protein
MNIFQQKDKLIELLSAPPQEISETERAELSALSENLRSSKFPIVFAGRFSCGKSLLINRLFFDDDLLPSNINPSTAKNMEIRYGESRRLLIIRDNLDSEDLAGKVIETIENPDMAQIRDYTNHKGDDLDRFDRFTKFILELPNHEVLRKGVSIIDTVGTEDIDDKYVSQTVNSIRDAAAVVFITDARQQLTASEADFLRKNVGKTPKKLFLAANKSDGRDEEELKVIRQDLLKRSAELFSESDIRADDQIFLTSAKTGDGLDDLRKRLITFISKDRVLELVKQGAETALELIAPISAGLKERIQNLEQIKTGRIESLRDKKQKLEELEIKLKDEEVRFDDNEDELLAEAQDTLKHNLKYAKDAILNSLHQTRIDRQELAKMLAGDAKNALDDTVRDTQKEISRLFRKRLSRLMLENDHDKLSKTLNQLGLVEAAQMTAPALGIGGTAMIGTGAYGVASTAIAAAAGTAGQGALAAIWTSLVGGTGAGAAATAALPVAFPLIAGGIAVVGTAYAVNKMLKSFKSRKMITLVEDYFSTLLNNKDQFKDSIKRELQRLKKKLLNEIIDKKSILEKDMLKDDPSEIENEIKTLKEKQIAVSKFEKRLKNFQITEPEFT